MWGLGIGCINLGGDVTCAKVAENEKLSKIACVITF
jgi:hypothetical protein